MGARATHTGVSAQNTATDPHTKSPRLGHLLLLCSVCHRRLRILTGHLIRDEFVIRDEFADAMSIKIRAGPVWLGGRFSYQRKESRG